MPINAFGGGPGSGKTYGVMEHVIIPAIAQGRFILTNIEGLQADAIYEYVAENYYKGEIICIGHIRTCDRNAPDSEGFFPGENALDQPMPVPSPETKNVCGGDLVVVDEATRYWPQGERIKKSHAYFFREHRHFANEIGHTCDLVVIDPDLSLLARPLRGKIEMASITHKPKEIGLNRYVVNLYRGCKITRKPQQTLGPYKFQEKIYSLYKSYAHEKAKEQAIDGRQNALRNPRNWFIAALVVGFIGFGFWNAWRFFHRGSTSQKNTSGSNAASAPASLQTVSHENQPKPEYSSNWRIAGKIFINGDTWIVLADQAGRLRYESPSAFSGHVLTLVGQIDSAKVTRWTAPAQSGQTAQPTQTLPSPFESTK